MGINKIFKKQAGGNEYDRLKKEIDEIKSKHSGGVNRNQAEEITSKSTPEASMGLQLLILHYLNMLDHLPGETNEEKAILLKPILKMDGTENIRKALSNIGGKKSKYSTPKNLKYIATLFEKAKLTDRLELVKKDLKKVTVDKGR